MSRQPPPRQRLVDAAVAHGARHGLSDTSLRQLAAALGTSHRMLIHHFGSKAGLLLEVVRAVEARQREALTRLLAAPGADDDEEVGRRFWAGLNDPELEGHERLFFEVYGQALQGREWATPLLDGVVDDWVDAIAERLVDRGRDPEEARVDARLGVAVTRGLLLDVLATGDRAAVDAAQERFLRLLAAG